MTLKGSEIFKKLLFHRRDVESAEKIFFFHLPLRRRQMKTNMPSASQQSMELQIN